VVVRASLLHETPREADLTDLGHPSAFGAARTWTQPRYWVLRCRLGSAIWRHGRNADSGVRVVSQLRSAWTRNGRVVLLAGDALLWCALITAKPMGGTHLVPSALARNKTSAHAHRSSHGAAYSQGGGDAYLGLTRVARRHRGAFCYVAGAASHWLQPGPGRRVPGSHVVATKLAIDKQPLPERQHLRPTNVSGLTSMGCTNAGPA
jgi:hypothetical protein